MWRSHLAVAVAACVVSASAAGYVMHVRDARTFEAQENPEADALKKAYGPSRNSYAVEEWAIRDFFRDKRDGVFVDVGANHYKIASNTYYLETALHWSGAAVEPLKQFEADYKRYRPRTRFRSFFVGDASNEAAKLYVLDKNTLVSSADQQFTAEQGKAPHAVEVPTITMNDLLDAEGVKTFDFLSLDVELWEPKALAGFDIDRFKPQLVCIEAHPQVRPQILDYFARHGYILVGKYLRADINNLYFTPFK
jgi:FkbM family methyltransferase